MTTTLTDNAEVARYLDAVRTHLAGLAEEDRAELLEDLEAHLDEVAAESDGPLAQRLGDPGTFAAELVASAGLAGPASSVTPVARARRALRASLAASPSLRALRDTPLVNRVLAFVPEMRPGWWVLRAYVAVVVLAGTDRRAIDSFPFPTLAGSIVVGLAVLAATTAGSVWWGRRSSQPGWRRRFTVALNVALLLVGLHAVSQARDQGGNRYYPVYRDPPGTLMSPDGRPITNLYPYDADGRALSGVVLYDQDGRPVYAAGQFERGDPSFPIDPRPSLPAPAITVPTTVVPSPETNPPAQAPAG